MKRWNDRTAARAAATAFLLAALTASVFAFAQDEKGGEGETDGGDGETDGGDGETEGVEGEGEAAVEPVETITLASPEEYRSYMEAERAAIAREREALLVLRAEVKKDIERLTTLQAQMDQRRSKLDEERDAKVKKLVKIYASMSPEEVKPLISKLDEDLMLRVLYIMKPKEQAAILALYTPEEAAKISEKILKKSF